MSSKSSSAAAMMGIDIGKNSFHVIGLDARGAIVLRQKWSRGQLEGRFANTPPCLIGMEACVGAHHLSRKLQEHGHDARLMATMLVARTRCEACRITPNICSPPPSKRSWRRSTTSRRWCRCRLLPKGKVSETDGF